MRSPLGILPAPLLAMQEELEVQLTKSMISLITRYPDGLERIEAAFEAVVEVGEELGLSFLRDLQLKFG